MEYLLRYRTFFLVLLLACTALFIYGLGKLRVNFSFDSIFPKGDPEYAYYQRFEEVFTEEQNLSVYVALESPAADIYDRAFLRQADSLFRELSAIEGVDSAIYATNFQEVRRLGTRVRARPYLRFNSEAAVEASRERIAEDSSMVGTFITRDFRYLCGYIFIEEEISDNRERDRVIEAIEQKLDDSGLEHKITGIPYIRTKYVEKIISEMLMFLTMSISFITIVLFITYRNFWGVVIPVVAVIVSLLWTLGFMGVTGQYIDLITNLLVPVLFVVGMSDVIHLMTKYLHERQQGLPPRQAMRITLDEIGVAIFLTSATTAIGFASLMVSNIPPIRTFGFYAAMGVLFTYAVSVIIIPNALLLLPEGALFKRKALGNHPLWDRILEGIYRISIQRSVLIVVLAVVIVILSVQGIRMVPLDSGMFEELNPKDPIYQDITFFEKQSYGMRPFELGIHTRNGHKLTDREVLLEIKKIQDYLARQAPFSPFLSIASFVSEANYINHFRRESHRRIPEGQAEIDELLAFARINGGGDVLDRLMNEEENFGRISARVADLGSERFSEIYQGLAEYVAVRGDTTLLEYRLTGRSYLADINLRYLRSSLFWGLAIAFVVIGLIMGWLYRSWKILLISMVPNIIPLLITGGVMGLFGISLSASTSIVFVVSFGIAVDNTIHFLSRYRLELGKGHKVEPALLETLKGTGKAMILTSVVLVAGFGMLLASDFGGTFSTGLFMALTITFALLSTLYLLPILLKYFHKIDEPY